MLPPRSFSAASGLAASAAATIAASSSPPPIAPRPSASTIAARVAALGDELVEHLLARRRGVTVLRARPAPTSARERRRRDLRLGRVAVAEARDQLAVTQLASACGLGAPSRRASAASK